MGHDHAAIPRGDSLPRPQRLRSIQVGLPRQRDEGHVEPGLAVVLMDRPFPAWTVARAASVMRERQRDPDAAAELAACPLLARGWRRTLTAT